LAIADNSDEEESFFEDAVEDDFSAAAGEESEFEADQFTSEQFSDEIAMANDPVSTEQPTQTTSSSSLPACAAPRQRTLRAHSTRSGAS